MISIDVLVFFIFLRHRWSGARVIVPRIRTAAVDPGIPESTVCFFLHPGKEDHGRGDHAPTWTTESFLSR